MLSFLHVPHDEVQVEPGDVLIFPSDQLEGFGLAAVVSIRGRRDKN